MNSKEIPPLGVLGSGEEVFLSAEISPKEKLVELVVPILRGIHAAGRAYVVEQIDFDFSVGTASCVVTGPGDKIVFASREKRLWPSRFVLGRQGEQSSSLTLVFVASSGFYRLRNLFVGERPVAEPWENSSQGESKLYWESHAFLWGTKDALCWSCGTTFTEPASAFQIGDVMLCASCVAKAPPKVKNGYIPGWGNIRVPEYGANVFPRPEKYVYVSK